MVMSFVTTSNNIFGQLTQDYKQHYPFFQLAMLYLLINNISEYWFSPTQPSDNIICMSPSLALLFTDASFTSDRQSSVAEHSPVMSTPITFSQAQIMRSTACICMRLMSPLLQSVMASCFLSTSLSIEMYTGSCISLPAFDGHA